MVQLLIYHNYENNRFMYHMSKHYRLIHGLGYKNQLGYVLIKIIK